MGLFFSFNLAPLEIRRDISMLGLIHRTMLNQGPPQFQKFFKRRSHEHTFRWNLRTRRNNGLHYPRSFSNLGIFKRSAHGLVAIYNMLPNYIVEAQNVKKFQSSLQQFVMWSAMSEFPEWRNMLSPRLPLSTHPFTRL